MPRICPTICKVVIKKRTHKQSLVLTFHIHPSKEMSMTTPMNCVKRMSGVKKDHTGHSAMLKLREKDTCHLQIHTNTETKKPLLPPTLSWFTHDAAVIYSLLCIHLHK